MEKHEIHMRFDENDNRYKLRYIFNLLRPRLFVLFTIDLTCWFIALLVPSIRFQMIAWAACMLVSNLSYFYFDYPKYLFVDYDQISYTEKLHIPLRHSTVFKTVKVTYCVTNVTSLELRQNWFERLFNTGHICFSGNTTFTAKKLMDRIYKRERHWVYGIDHFNEFSKKCAKLFPNACIRDRKKRSS